MAAPKKPAKGKYIVDDDVFIYTSKAGDRLEIDMDLPAEVLKKATEGPDTDEDQMSAVLDWVGDESRTAFDGMRLLERIRFSKTFFDEFAKAVEIPLGESLSSSTS